MNRYGIHRVLYVFFFQQKEQISKIKEGLHDEISFHEEQIKRHQEAINRHKKRIGDMPDIDTK